MKTIKVGWCPYNRGYEKQQIDSWKDTVFFDPAPAIQDIAKTTSSLYIRCPAWLEYFKNVYVIKCPVDFTLRLDKNNKSVWIDRYGKEFIEENMHPRWNDSGPTDKLMFSISFSYLFCSDDNVELELMPAWFHYSDLLKNIRAVPGKFNIHKWPRPIDFGFEVEDDRKEIVFKRGDPLIYVKFNTNDGSKIILERMSLTTSDQNLISSIASFKNYVKNVSLEDCYQSTKSLIKNKKWFKKSCPFGFKK